MPASYAHHRFGQLAFPMLPEEVRRNIQRFRRLYNVGQHGPDLFFYYQPLFSTKMGELGYQYHAAFGKDFFEGAAEKLREQPSEGGEAYIFGVLGHFVLDSLCHPMIRGTAAEGTIGHTELETEYDRYLLTLDGEAEPHRRNLAKHVRLTWGESQTIAGFYPPATAFTIRRSAVSMAMINRLLTAKNRRLLNAAFSLGGKSAGEMVMYSRVNHKCAHLMQPLDELFDQAMERYPVMARELQACIREKSPLGVFFDSNFG